MSAAIATKRAEVHRDAAETMTNRTKYHFKQLLVKSMT
jgi:hypothetical protein